MSDPVVLLSTGDVVGPAGGVTDNSMVLFSGTSGKLIKGNNAVVTTQGLALLDDLDAASNRATIGLNQVNNTSDLNKPVSTAQQAAIDTKATKATTLCGYGITDALPNLVPTVGSNYTLRGDQYVFLSASNIAHLCQNAVWDGSQWNRINTSLGGIVVLARDGQLLVQPFSAGANPLSFPNLHSVINSSNLATDAQINAGSDVVGFVNPRSLRLGFSVSLAANGYIAFPSWLGGLIVQWGNAYIDTNGTRYLFPIQFPNNLFALNISAGEDTTGVAEVMNVVPGSKTRSGFTANATATSTYAYIAIGN